MKRKKRTPIVPGGCYWCGRQAEGREHVIPSGFFKKTSATERIIVPACKDHNCKLSHLDEQMRFVIQSCTGHFSDATLRGAQRPQARSFIDPILSTTRLVWTDNVESGSYKISGRLVCAFLEKLSRGIYYTHEGLPFPGSIGFTASHILGREDRTLEIETVQKILNALKPGTNERALREGKKTDDGIFKYHYYSTIENKRRFFALVGVFYESFSFLAVGRRKSFRSHDWQNQR